MDLSKLLSGVGNAASGIGGVFGLGYSIFKDQHLTGAQREANAFTADQNQKSMDFSAAQAQHQMDFQREMSDTSWQRGVKDMQSAGLNPALAYGQGGASAMQGAAASGSAGSSVDPGRGTSLSEMLQAAQVAKQLELTDAQIRDTLASAREKNSVASKTDKETSWIDATTASAIGLNNATMRKYGAEIEGILSSAEGQRLYNEWQPQIWAQDLRKGEVQIDQTIVGIQHAIQDIENLKATESNIKADTRYKQLLQGLTAAQISLVKSQDSKTRAEYSQISVNTWKSNWENEFIHEHGLKPDSNLWSLIVQTVSGLTSKK